MAPAEEGPALDLAPQEIWRRLAGPFDARAVVAWGARLEVLGCERCGAHWAAAQLADGVRLRWTTRRICAELAARLVSAAGAQGMVGGDEPA